MKNVASDENNFGDIHEELYLLNLVLRLSNSTSSYVNSQMSMGEFFHSLVKFSLI